MAAAPTITRTMPEPDVALLTLDTPARSANILSLAVLEELGAHLDRLEDEPDVAGVILMSGKPGMFIAGADLREFAASLSVPRGEVVAMAQRGQQLFRRLSLGDWVSVVAIDGVCVGGGAELACWCDRRVVSTGLKTEIGFPEVKLGLLPGWGGTVRAPRIIGLANAVEMITSGESIGGEEAAAMGLASDRVPADRLLEAALAIVRLERRTRQYLGDRQRWSQPLAWNETELAFLGVTASAVIQQQTKGQYPAPERALELMLETIGLDADAALEREAEALADLFGSPVNAALLNVFFLTDRIKKDRGVDREQVAPREIRRVGVVGAGIMGAGIAAANLKHRLPVVLSDAAADALARGARGALDEAAYDRRTKQADPQRLADMGVLLTATSATQEMAGCDLVVEAVVENLDVKRHVYARLEPLLGDDGLLASNTSTIPITRLAENLQRPERFCGLHFFNPVRRMKLVEVIRGARTSDETVATAVAYAKQIGKLPIVVQDGPGFLVNRLLLPYMNEALELISDGAEIRAIERAAKAFGMPMGPIELYDMVGLDTAFYAGRTMWEAYPERIGVSPILIALVKAGRLGQKTGQGFFRYDPRKKRPEPDPELQPFVEPHVRGRREFRPDELTARLFLPMLLEATRVLEESIVRDPRDVDFGLIYGLGFPPFKGGLLFWADTLGAARILEMLQPLEPLGARVQPTESLLEMAREGRTFYSGGQS